MENPLLDSDIIYKNNTEYAFLAQVSYSKDLLQILIDEMQFLLKFTSDNKTYLKCSNCELLYVLQSQENLSIQIFHQKKAKCQIGNNQDQCLQCQQFKNGGCFKNASNVIQIKSLVQRMKSKGYFAKSVFLKYAKFVIQTQKFLIVFRQMYIEQCNQLLKIYLCYNNDDTIIHLLPIFIVLNFKKQKFQRQFMEFHQYIFAKYQPVIILFFYQVFLIVYLVKVFLILINFVIERNKERINNYFD